MKKILIGILLLICFSRQLIAQDQHTRLYYFIKVWGLLKYYHPTVQKGSIDWDKQFLQGAAYILGHSSSSGSNEINKLIEASGKESIPSSASGLLAKYQASPYSNLDFSWLLESNSRLSPDDQKWLYQVVSNYRPAKNVYVEREINKYYFNTPSEKYWYPSEFVPDSSQSLLTLARFWNIINYFNPHKSLFDKNWDQSLKEFISLALQSASKKEFYKTFAQIAVSINDGHALYNNYEFDSLIGLKRPAIITSLYENKYNLVIFISEALKQQTGISKGDIITAINGENVELRRNKLRPFCLASTEKGTERNIDAILWNGNAGQQYKIEYTDVNGKSRLSNFELTKDLFLKYAGNTDPKVVDYKEHNAVYVRIPATRDDLKSAFDLAERPGSTLILDLRSGNPMGTNWDWLLGKLISNRVLVAKYYRCSFTYPGYFEEDALYKKPLSSTFTKNFKGKLIVLANEKMQSSLEYNLMTIKAAFPGVTIIGRNTAGADGAAASVLVQDNILTYFTRDVVLWPDGKQTQRTGIVPDIYVEDSVEFFRQGKDAVLEVAFKLLSKQ